MRAVILVGGEGTRLRPLTYHTPKAMVPVLGRPFLEHLILYLRRHGVDTIDLALGHQPDPIRAYFGDGSRWGVSLRMAVEPTPLGSGGAIKQFARELSEPFFALNGDILTTLDLDTMRRQHRESGAAISIALIEVDDPTAFGVVALDGDERISRFVEKPPRDEAPSRWANAGVWLFEPRMLDRIPAGRRSMVETALFPEVIAAGERLQGYTERCFWADIGTPRRYLEAQLRLLEQPVLRVLPLSTWRHTSILSSFASTATLPVIAGDATVTGPVVIDPETVIESGATIVGPAVIGPCCTIGAGARVERAVLWEGCRIGRGANLRDSVLAGGVRLGDETEVTGVVAGHGAAIGPNTRLVGI